MLKICKQTVSLCLFAFVGFSFGQSHWQVVSPLPQNNYLYGVAYGNNQFVAVGDAGTILTSPDGSTWTSQTSGTQGLLQAVTYGDSLFVAVGGHAIFTSPDGTTWTVQTSGTMY